MPTTASAARQQIAARRRRCLADDALDEVCLSVVRFMRVPLVEPVFRHTLNYGRTRGVPAPYLRPYLAAPQCARTVRDGEARCGTRQPVSAATCTLASWARQRFRSFPLSSACPNGHVCCGPGATTMPTRCAMVGPILRSLGGTRCRPIRRSERRNDGSRASRPAPPIASHSTSPSKLTSR